MNTIKIRKAKRKNFRKIAKIYAVEFSKTPFKEKWTIAIAIKKLKLFSKYCDIWEIEYEKKLVGFLVINPNQWLLGEIIFGEEMAIDEKFQRKGIGKEVFDKIFNIYKKKGFKKYLGIVNKKSRAWGLHKKVGGKESNNDKIIEVKLK